MSMSSLARVAQTKILAFPAFLSGEGQQPVTTYKDLPNNLGRSVQVSFTPKVSGEDLEKLLGKVVFTIGEANSLGSASAGLLFKIRSRSMARTGEGSSGIRRHYHDASEQDAKLYERIIAVVERSGILTKSAAKNRRVAVNAL